VSAEIPSTEPAALRIGDTWKWTKSLADYPATSWTLKYRFKTAAGGFEVTASASGSDHAITVAATTTAALAAGDYGWLAWVESGAEKYTVGAGTVELLPDYRAADATAGLDDRSHARKMLDALEAWLESRDPAVAEYEIAGRRMKYVPLPELVRLRQRYATEVANEVAAAKIAAGLGTSGRRIQFRV
jgi:hypothetical protein